jgi:GTP-binding protein EngB required for normal cell division
MNVVRLATTVPPPAVPDLHRLSALARFARAAGATAVAAEADALAARIEEGRFYVACVGQFKRGKSTLINALVGSEILPVGVIPVTSVVTVVRHGNRVASRVLLPDGWREIDPGTLAAWVTESANPGNIHGVQGVEIFVPSPLLASGLCLVDTPGLGSISAANSAATRQFVPHIDAAVAVLGADPPISGEELDLLAEVARQTSHLVVVLNKADRLPEPDRAEAARFTREAIERRLGRSVTGLFEVSAAERLRQTAPPGRDWQALVTSLQSLGETAGTSLLRGAQERGTALLGSRLLREINGQREALERPLEETAERLRRLDLALADDGRAVADLGPLLTAEQERFGRRLNEERERFLSAALPDASAELNEAFTPAGPAGPASGLAAAARDIARRRVEAWRAGTQAEAETLYRALAARFVDLANGLLAGLGRLPGLEGLPLALLPEAGFRTASGFFFNDLLTVGEPSFGRSFLSRIGGEQPALRHANEYLRRLLETNSARVVNDLQERALQSRRRLESEIRARLNDLSTSARRAFDNACAAQAAGADRVRSEIERLDELRRAVEGLLYQSGFA